MPAGSTTTSMALSFTTADRTKTASDRRTMTTDTRSTATDRTRAEWCKGSEISDRARAISRKPGMMSDWRRALPDLRGYGLDQAHHICRRCQKMRLTPPPMSAGTRMSSTPASPAAKSTTLSGTWNYSIHSSGRTRQIHPCSHRRSSRSPPARAARPESAGLARGRSGPNALSTSSLSPRADQASSGTNCQAGFPASSAT